jgi:hypothetical protein
MEKIVPMQKRVRSIARQVEIVVIRRSFIGKSLSGREKFLLFQHALLKPRSDNIDRIVEHFTICSIFNTRKPGELTVKRDYESVGATSSNLVHLKDSSRLIANFMITLSKSSVFNWPSN